jgi:hypothetical protein
MNLDKIEQKEIHPLIASHRFFSVSIIMSENSISEVRKFRTTNSQIFENQIFDNLNKFEHMDGPINSI